MTKCSEGVLRCPHHSCKGVYSVGTGQTRKSLVFPGYGNYHMEYLRLTNTIIVLITKNMLDY